MKRAEDCNSIEEILDCIDELDKEIIHNLSIRSTFVKNAAKLMKSGEDIKNGYYIESMIKNRRDWASEYGLDPEFIEEIYENIVSYCIGSGTGLYSRDDDKCGKVRISFADLNDASTILSMQKRAYIQEVELNDNNFNIPPMLQTIESMRDDFKDKVILKAKIRDQIVGSVRAKQTDTTCFIGRLIVEPIYQGRGIGKKLLQSIENVFPNASVYELFTGQKSLFNREFYKRAGYIEVEEYDAPDGTRMIKLRKNKL